MVVRWIESLGARLIAFVAETGSILIFLGHAAYGVVRPPYRPALFLEQFHFIANRSLGIITVTGVFTGMVFAIQFYFGFSVVDADALVGPSSALSLSRELAPVFAAVVVTGRAGAAMAAELGSMRVTEQIAAMEVMAVNPIQYLVSPRIAAGMVALPLLTILFLFIGCVGAYIAGVHLLGIDPHLFYAHLRDFAIVDDILQGIIKAAVFGVMFSCVSTYSGFVASGGAKAVGNATNHAVVVTLVLILISDYFLTLFVRTFLYG